MTDMHAVDMLHLNNLNHVYGAPSLYSYYYISSFSLFYANYIETNRCYYNFNNGTSMNVAFNHDPAPPFHPTLEKKYA